ncbi:hypothetical protein FB45DRAFT_819535 [Roridomyces roridus]|uniref:HTH APSES-type domain-containing protein n=1 Tax=Roridomyces roridus TaxID=1738132 RepID=A0AAD7CJB5_9AGAR|nr:hypothetical protein FB45DRAFT_819535 [Roridomyces roridus]
MTTSPTRPALPVRHANSRIADILKGGALPPVKYQILNCQGQDILVGRLKVDTPTPSGHAFILRRFDTNAVSLTTMFRAAYPSAPEDAEKREVQWVKETFDLTGNNGSSKDTSITRLAGTWVNPTDALELGTAYALGELIQLVVQSKPDPNAIYRRSGKKDTPASPPSSQPARAPQSPATGTPNPAKRRKESSPAPAPAQAPAAATTPLPPRRSARAKSPKPPSAPMPSFTTVVVKSPKKVSRRDEEVVTPGGSDETAVDEEEGDVMEESVGTGLREQDLAEQREMIEDLKAKRAEALAAKEMEESDESSAKLKRAREDEDKKLQFEFREPEIGERAIATNTRITPSQRSFVWGTLAFAFGVAAVNYIPGFL